jgi:hypothetical protein
MNRDELIQVLRDWAAERLKEARNDDQSDHAKGIDYGMYIAYKTSASLLRLIPPDRDEQE